MTELLIKVSIACCLIRSVNFLLGKVLCSGTCRQMFTDPSLKTGIFSKSFYDMWLTLNLQFFQQVKFVLWHMSACHLCSVVSNSAHLACIETNLIISIVHAI